MPTRDGTGPMGHGPMTGGGRGSCAATADHAFREGRGMGRGGQHRRHATGPSSWERLGQTTARPGWPSEKRQDALMRVEQALADVQERLTRLESGARDG